MTQSGTEKQDAFKAVSTTKHYMKQADTTLRPVIMRISNRIHIWDKLGRLNHKATHDPIIWSGRDHNTAADAVCNYILDKQIDNHHYTANNYTDFVNRRANIFIQSDRACRAGKISSVGWKIKAINPTLQHSIMMSYGGTRIYKGMPSLVIEAIALDQATDQLHKMIMAILTNNPQQ